MLSSQTFGAPEKRRRRLRGVLTSRRGKQVGLISFLAPLTGYVIQDLHKPDSVIKSIARRAYAYLSERKTAQRQRIDPAGRVEVLQTESTQNVPQVSQSGKE